MRQVAEPELDAQCVGSEREANMQFFRERERFHQVPAEVGYNKGNRHERRQVQEADIPNPILLKGSTTTQRMTR